MRRRDIPRALIASAAGAALFGQRAEAQTCTAPCYARTTDEITAGVTPVNYAYAPGNIRRYGAVVDGSAPDEDAIRLALNAVPLSGGRIYCDPPGRIKVATTVYIPQRISGPDGVGIDMDFEGCTIIGNGVGTIFESGTGNTSLASNVNQPNESSTSMHLGTRIHGATFAQYGIAIKLFNFVQGCSLSNLKSFSGKTFIHVTRCFYLAWNEINANVAGLATTDPIIDLYDEINTMTFNNVHVAGSSTRTGIGYRFNSAVKGMTLTGIGAEALTVGYKFIGQILGVLFTGNYVEANVTAIQLGSASVGLNIEGNYFNGNGTAITGNNWQSGRWGHNKYDSDGVATNIVDLSGTGNLCEVWLEPRQYTRQGAIGAHTGWTLLPSNWSINPGCRLVLTDYIYHDAVGFNVPIALLSSAVSGNGVVAKQFTGRINATHSGQVPFCTTSVAGTTVTVDTKIPFDADAGGIVFDMIVDDNLARRYVSGRTYGGTNVFRYDTLGASGIAVTVTNSGGFFRFVFAGFVAGAGLVGGEIRIV
jgi:hypothetical protein